MLSLILLGLCARPALLLELVVFEATAFSFISVSTTGVDWVPNNAVNIPALAGNIAYCTPFIVETS